MVNAYLLINLTFNPFDYTDQTKDVVSYKATSSLFPIKEIKYFKENSYLICIALVYDYLYDYSVYIRDINMFEVKNIRFYHDDHQRCFCYVIYRLFYH